MCYALFRAKLEIEVLPEVEAKRMPESLIKSLFRAPLVLALLTATFILASPCANAQQEKQPPPARQQPAQEAVAAKSESSPESRAKSTASVVPVFTEYKGVRIGMTTDEVRSKLDHLKDKDKSQDFFVFSDAESVQVIYDNKGKVSAISVNYMGNKSNAPSAKDVLGKDVLAKADGSMYELVRYPEAGYWVAYSRTAGDNPLVTVTMQKME